VYQIHTLRRARDKPTCIRTDQGQQGAAKRYSSTGGHFPNRLDGCGSPRRVSAAEPPCQATRPALPIPRQRVCIQVLSFTVPNRLTNKKVGRRVWRIRHIIFLWNIRCKRVAGRRTGRASEPLRVYTLADLLKMTEMLEIARRRIGSAHYKVKRWVRRFGGSPCCTGGLDDIRGTAKACTL
jgi:hypothetical protein